jgi:hypothetical protein
MVTSSADRNNSINPAVPRKELQWQSGDDCHRPQVWVHVADLSSGSQMPRALLTKAGAGFGSE